MKKYIEAIEDTTGKSEDYQGDFIQEEVEINYSATKQKIAKDKGKLREKVGKKYKYRLHTCNHEEGQPCTVEDI